MRKLFFLLTLILNFYAGYSQELPMSEKMAKTVMTIWADSMSLEEQPAYWTYQQGFVLMGIESVWRRTGDK